MTVVDGAKSRATLPGNGGAVKLLGLSADGRRVATLGRDGQVRVWDVGGQRLVGGFPWKPDQEVTAVALTATGDQLLLGGPDGAVRVWKLPP